MLLSSTTRPVSMLPTSPISLVRTVLRAAPENSEMFFCAPEPYCRTVLASSILMVLEKSSTDFRSASVRFSKVKAGASTFFSAELISSAGLGASWAASSGVRVSVGLYS